MESANQTHCWPIRRTKEGLSNSRDELVELVGHGPAHPPPEGGGRRQGGRGKGQTYPREGIPYQTANRLPVSNPRPPDILDG